MFNQGSLIEEIFLIGAVLGGLYFAVRVKLLGGKISNYFGLYTLYMLLALTFAFIGLIILPSLLGELASGNLIIMGSMFLMVMFGAVAPVLHKYCINRYFWKVKILVLVIPPYFSRGWK